MALTREYKQTVLARIKRDPKFAQALYAEAVNALLEGETDAGLSMLRDLVHAGITFKELSKQTGLGEKDFAISLLQTEKVAIVPGSAFGENGKGFCRACFATSYEQLVEASNRIERHVEFVTSKK